MKVDVLLKVILLACRVAVRRWQLAGRCGSLRCSDCGCASAAVAVVPAALIGCAFAVSRELLKQLAAEQDTVSEWLRRWTRNPLGSARRGSNPLGVAAHRCKRSCVALNLANACPLPACASRGHACPRNRAGVRQHVARGLLSVPARFRGDLREPRAGRRQSRQPIARMARAGGGWGATLGRHVGPLDCCGALRS